MSFMSSFVFPAFMPYVQKPLQIDKEVRPHSKTYQDSVRRFRLAALEVVHRRRDGKIDNGALLRDLARLEREAGYIELKSSRWPNVSFEEIPLPVPDGMDPALFLDEKGRPIKIQILKINPNAKKQVYEFAEDGCEEYANTDLMCDTIREGMEANMNDPDLGWIVIGGLNAFGKYHKVRWNEEGVNLSRARATEKTPIFPENDELIRKFSELRLPARLRIRDLKTLRTIYQYIKDYGFKACQQAFTGSHTISGFYPYHAIPKPNQGEPIRIPFSTQVLNTLFHMHTPFAEDVVIKPRHSGVGQSARIQPIISCEGKDTEEYRRAEAMLPDEALYFMGENKSSEEFYPGRFDPAGAYLEAINPQARVTCITLEIGTEDWEWSFTKSKTTLWGLRHAAALAKGVEQKMTTIWYPVRALLAQQSLADQGYIFANRKDERKTNALTERGFGYRRQSSYHQIDLDGRRIRKKIIRYLSPHNPVAMHPC